MDALAALRVRRFALYSIVNFLAFAASWMQRLAIGWAVWSMTGSGLLLGVLAACDLGPALLLGPIGGVLADRFGSRGTILWGQGAIVILTSIAATLVWFAAPFWALMLVAAAIGSAVAIQDAPRAAIVTSLVPPEQNGAAIALTAILINAARFMGPAVAGGVAALAGLGSAMLVAALAGLPMLLFALRLPGASVAKPASKKSWTHDLADGLRYARRDRLIALVLVNFGLSALFARAAYELLPGIVDSMFKRGFAGVSTMTAAIGIGAIVAGFAMLGRRDVRSAIRISLVSAAFGGLAVVGLAVVPGFAGAVVVAGVMGFCISMTAIAAQVAVQLQADLAFRARVLSLWALIIRAAPAAGALVIGSVSDAAGFRWPLLVGGILAILVAAGVGILFARQAPEAAH